MAGRRRRSARVRRYASSIPPAAAPARVAAPPLAPPSRALPAEEVALVRPYYADHERLRAAESPVPAHRRPEPDEVQRAFAQVQERAAAIVRQWSENPEGDLLSGPAPRFGVVRARPGEWDELAGLTRTWLSQRRGEVPA
ncbi:hypothetical protein [Nocardiopsis sp. FR6]|uniref:hypothetical protein n=1 Tax=unclassified Nocardiopsis TaxID=2649073 RepID=UPI00351A4D31